MPKMHSQFDKGSQSAPSGLYRPRGGRSELGTTCGVMAAWLNCRIFTASAPHRPWYLSSSFNGHALTISTFLIFTWDEMDETFKLIRSLILKLLEIGNIDIQEARQRARKPRKLKLKITITKEWRAKCASSSPCRYLLTEQSNNNTLCIVECLWNKCLFLFFK